LSAALQRDTTGADYVIVVGHNEKGNIRLSNGEAISFEDLHVKVAKAGKRLIFVSCNAQSSLEQSSSARNDANEPIPFSQLDGSLRRNAYLYPSVLGTSGSLTFDLAFKITRELSKQILAGASIDRLSNNMLAIEDKSRRKVAFKILGIRIIEGMGSIVAVAVIIQMLECEDSTKPCKALGVTDGHDPTRMLFEALDGRRLSELNAAILVEQGPQPCDCWNAKTLLSSRAWQGCVESLPSVCPTISLSVAMPGSSY
jgi:hypothetical protein